MKKVLIITYSFPPLNNIASRRFGELVHYLEELDWEVDVLTTNSQGTLPINLSEENILRFNQHPQKKSMIDKEKSHNNIMNIFLTIKRRLGYNLRLFDRTYYNWYKQIIESGKLQNKSYDIILSSYGPSASLYLGNYLSKEWNIPWIADFRDLGSLYEDKNYKSNFISRFIDKKIENKLLRNVSAIISVGDVLADILGEHYSKPSYPIFNGWADNKVESFKKEPNEKYIYYAGRLYPHQMKSLYKLVNVLSKLPNPKLIIRSLGPKYLNEELNNYIKEKSLSKRINILEPTDQEQVSLEAEGAFVNLVIEDLDESIYWKKGTLTGKFLGLLPFSPPILTIAREDSEIGEILRITNKGQICSTEEKIYKFLKSVNSDAYKGNENVALYSKKYQAKKLNEILNNYI